MGLTSEWRGYRVAFGAEYSYPICCACEVPALQYRSNFLDMAIADSGGRLMGTCSGGRLMGTWAQPCSQVLRFEWTRHAEAISSMEGRYITPVSGSAIIYAL